MNAKDVIQQVQENCSEYLEMTDNPSAFVVGVLAHKVIQLQDYIEYLERRLKHEHNKSSTRSRNS